MSAGLDAPRPAPTTTDGLPDPYCHSVSVAGVVVRDDGRVLAVKRRDNGAWQPPGGVLEPGEAITDGLVREVEEEAGVVVRPGPLTGAYKHTGRPIVCLVFRCDVVRQVWPAARTTGPETAGLWWMSRADVIREMDRVFAARVLDALDHRAAPAVRAHDGRSFGWAWRRRIARRWQALRHRTEVRDPDGAWERLATRRAGWMLRPALGAGAMVTALLPTDVTRTVRMLLCSIAVVGPLVAAAAIAVLVG